jgi:hypothetical protein
MNRNEVLDLGVSDSVFGGRSLQGAPTHVSVVGGPAGLFYGYQVLGIYSAADIANPAVAKYPGAVATDIRYKDVNADGVIRQGEDFEVIGSPWPDFVWGMTNSFALGRFGLRTTLDGQLGGQTINQNLATVDDLSGLTNVSRKYFEGMFVSADSAGNGMTPGLGSSSPEGRRAYRDISSRLVEDADYLWLRNVQLSYDLPARLVPGMRADGPARLYLTVENPLLFSACDCNPPSAATDQMLTTQLLTSRGALLTPGVTDFSYPLARVWVLGLQLGL